MTLSCTSHFFIKEEADWSAARASWQSGKTALKKQALLLASMLTSSAPLFADNQQDLPPPPPPSKGRWPVAQTHWKLETYWKRSRKASEPIPRSWSLEKWGTQAGRTELELHSPECRSRMVINIMEAGKKPGILRNVIFFEAHCVIDWCTFGLCFMKLFIFI